MRSLALCCSSIAFLPAWSSFRLRTTDSLTLIKSVIDDSDYYLVLLAGKYGSQPPGETKSFTHLEYDYALATGKPTIALLHSNPGLLPADKTERSDDGRRLLDGFREELRKKNGRLWKDPGGAHFGSLHGVQHLKKTRASVGWIRGSEIGGEGLKDELPRLRRAIDSLSGELAVARSRSAPEGLEDLAQGAETTNVTIEFESGSQVVSRDVRWDSLMRAVLPQTFGGGAPPEAIAAAVSSLVQRMPGSGAEHGGWQRSVVSRSDYGKIVNQMVALGLVEGHRDPTNPLATRWGGNAVRRPNGLSPCRGQALTTSVIVAGFKTTTLIGPCYNCGGIHYGRANRDQSVRNARQAGGSRHAGPGRSCCCGSSLREPPSTNSWVLIRGWLKKTFELVSNTPRMWSATKTSTADETAEKPYRPLIHADKRYPGRQMVCHLRSSAFIGGQHFLSNLAIE